LGGILVPDSEECPILPADMRRSEADIRLQ
jgi:hypothetical protein